MPSQRLLDLIAQEHGEALNQTEWLHALRLWLHRELSGIKEMPIDMVHWVPLSKVQANDYNPNSVAPTEMRLLHTSIKSDGYTQPVVTVYDPEADRYIIVDGFHRYTTMRLNGDIQAMTGGLLPVVVINKTLAERMQATIRHNRARGKHAVTGMSNMVFQMLDQGMTDEDICQELGMEAVELNRLKHITGFAKLFEDSTYNPSWKTDKQAKIERDYRDSKEPK